MRSTNQCGVGQIALDYEIVDNDFKRADQIRLPVSAISKLIKKKRKHILKEHLLNINYCNR
jgi:hypothetical protein